MAKHSAYIEVKWRDNSPTVSFSVGRCGDEELSGVTNCEPPDCSNPYSVLALLSLLTQLLLTAEASP